MKSVSVVETKNIISFQKMKNFLITLALRASPDGSANTGFKIISGKQYTYYDRKMNDKQVKISLSPIMSNEPVFAITLFLDKEKIYTIPRIEFSQDYQKAQELINKLDSLINQTETEIISYGKS